MQKVAWSISDSAGKRCISEYPVCVMLIGLTMITLGGRLGNQTDSEVYCKMAKMVNTILLFKLYWDLLLVWSIFNKYFTNFQTEHDCLFGKNWCYTMVAVAWWYLTASRKWHLVAWDHTPCSVFDPIMEAFFSRRVKKFEMESLIIDQNKWLWG